MNDDIDEHLGRKLRRRRRLLGLTQQQLAAACGVRFQQIQKYECAANRMSAGRLWQLAKVLDVPVSYFFEGLESSIEPAVPREADTSRESFASETRELIRVYPPLENAPPRRAFGSHGR
jgi:transcriptional regulator with XRE-family HTH domain